MIKFQSKAGGMASAYFSASTGLISYIPYLPNFLYIYLPLLCWPATGPASQVEEESEHFECVEYESFI